MEIKMNPTSGDDSVPSTIHVQAAVVSRLLFISLLLLISAETFSTAAPPLSIYSVSGSIADGAGAAVALTGTASTTVKADGSGNFTFDGLPNGKYRITPSLPGYTISATRQAVTIDGDTAPSMK